MRRGRVRVKSVAHPQKAFFKYYVHFLFFL